MPQRVLSLLLLLAAIAASSSGFPSPAPSASDPAFDTASWARLLERHAHDGGLDYGALAADRADLDAFLQALESAEPDGWTHDEQLAFWSNAYNAVVAEFVLELYPDLESVKGVDGFFDAKRRRVAGERLTLDEIEGRGRDLGDPRVHFAVVCASASCPDLPAEPLDPARLDRQLDELTRAFLADPDKGLRYDDEDNTLWLSSIFKWYAGDFTGGSTLVAYFARGRVLEWVLPHVAGPLRATLAERDPAVKYLDYDWSLNDR